VLPHRPIQSNSAGAMAVASILALKHPLRPGRGKVPLPLRKLLPDPLHEDGWRMLTHDLSELTQAERRARAFRLRVAIALSPADEVPRWAVVHLAALESAA